MLTSLLKPNAVYALAGSALLGGSALAAPTIEYTSGHADFGVAYEDDALFLHYHFAGGTVIDGSALADDAEVNADDVYVRVPSSQATSRPAGGVWDFLGNDTGEPIWLLPQGSPPAGVPFFGTAGEELDPAEWNGPITYTFSIVQMPDEADFSMWQSDIFGSPVVAVATSDGFPDTLDVPAGSHSHYNWGFTQEGVYQFNVVASGDHITDGQVSDEGELWFAVGDATVIPEPGSLALLGLGGLALLRRRH